MSEPRRDRHSLPSHYAGVPLGGIGTGCLELGEDARFRNITINNNRSAATRIPFAPGAFVAIRAACGGEAAARVLQPDSSAPFEAAGIEDPYTNPDDLTWYGLYPASNFRLDSEDFPLSVQWSCLSPVVPYDTEASTLPLMMSVLQFTNTTSETYSISGMFNWENLRGCTAAESPEDRGTTNEVVFSEVTERVALKGTVRLHPDDPPPLPIGLSFGIGDGCRSNAEGNYCLVSDPSDDVQITYSSRPTNSAEALKSVWEAFADRGSLSNVLSGEDNAHSGSVCASATVGPGETRRLLFVLAWYCPKYVVDGEDLGPGYSRDYSNALEIAEYGLKHSHYLQGAVANWHQRFLQSTFPDWYTRMLINSCHVFTTNSMLTRDGEFALMESPQDPIMGVLDRSFYSSIGTVLFFPDLAHRELELFAGTDEESEPGRIYRELGRNTVRSPGYGGAEQRMLDINAKFVLLACRNFHLTGKTVMMMNLLPRLREAMEWGLRLDRDGDGMPDVDGAATTFRGWAMYGLNSYAGGLWIDAMLAYAGVLRHLKYPEEARAYEERARHALRYFEQRLWNEEGGYYRFYCDARREEPTDHPRLDEGCHSGQLAGSWYSDFMNLEAGYSHGRIVRALDAITRLDGRAAGIAKGYTADGTPCENPPLFDGDTDAGSAWPSYTLAYFACPLIARGSVDEGLEVIKNIYQNIHVRHKRVYNQPLAWDPDRNEAAGPLFDRHVGALSVWYTLFALQGFYLNAPEGSVRIAPQLPEGVNHLASPLFTPSTFGWLTYQVAEKPSYRQEVRVTFESPVLIGVVELAVPRSIASPRVTMTINEEPVSYESQLIAGEPRNRLLITLDNATQLLHPIDVLIEG